MYGSEIRQECIAHMINLYFSLPRLFVFLFDVLNVAVYVIRDKFVKKPTCAYIFILV